MPKEMYALFGAVIAVIPSFFVLRGKMLDNRKDLMTMMLEKQDRKIDEQAKKIEELLEKVSDLQEKVTVLTLENAELNAKLRGRGRNER